MRKINIFIIFSDHLSTLYNDKTGKMSLWDVATFYGLPIVFGALYYLFPFPLPNDINTALIAVFSVFAALLFSAQMALYGLSPQPPQKSNDPTTYSREHRRFERDRKYFSDVNFNVSYLILLSCISLIVFLTMLTASLPQVIEGAILSVFVSHFFLTLLMLVKRTHIAFSSKYTNGL